MVVIVKHYKPTPVNGSQSVKYILITSKQIRSMLIGFPEIGTSSGDPFKLITKKQEMGVLVTVPTSQLVVNQMGYFEPARGG